jgi:hypothetical protein
MTNDWLKDQGLLSVKELWVHIHYPATRLPAVLSRFIRQLGSMPYSNDPYGLILGSIEKTIRPYNYLAKR